MKTKNIVLRGLALALMVILCTGTVMTMASTSSSVSVNAGAAKVLDTDEEKASASDNEAEPADKAEAGAGQETVSGNDTSNQDVKEEGQSSSDTEQKQEEKTETIEEAEEPAAAAPEEIPEKKVSYSPVEFATESGTLSTDKLVVANVQDSVNVRSEASEESELAGKLYKGCAGELLEQSSGWSKIKSGALTGWIKNDFLVTGAQAQDKAKSEGIFVATVSTETLRVRKDADEGAGVYGLMAVDEEATVREDMGDWVAIRYDSDQVGYVSREYVKLSYIMEEGESIESINARAKAEEKKAQETKETSDENKPKAETKAPSGATNNGSIAASADDVTLLAALIQCEAGYETYEGKVAVGTVVVNRLRSGSYGNSMYSVIFAKGQFGPAGSGKVERVLAKGPNASCIQAATDAINGVSMVGNATKFRNVRSGKSGIVIDNHVFW